MEYNSMTQNINKVQIFSFIDYTINFNSFKNKINSWVQMEYNFNIIIFTIISFFNTWELDNDFNNKHTRII